MRKSSVFEFIKCALFCGFLTTLMPGATEAAELRVMSFNLWVGGEAGQRPLSVSAKVIRAAKADIVGLQETHGKAADGPRQNNGALLARMLGWHYSPQHGGSPGILSRFPIVNQTPKGHGVSIQLPSGKLIHVFNVHLMHAPYQPYQLLRIPYAQARFISTADEAVAEALDARGKQVEELIDELKPAIATGEPVFLTGDFNEPSHLDWTDRAFEAGKCPLPVAWPSTRAVMQAGLHDSDRSVHRNEVTHPGLTWTPITRPDDPKDRHDRIDFVFCAGENVSVSKCEVVGEKPESSDIVIQPYPSDHRAVVATVKVP